MNFASESNRRSTYRREDNVIPDNGYISDSAILGGKNDSEDRWRWRWVLLAFLLLLLLSGFLLWWFFGRPLPDTGSRIMSMGEMSVEEARSTLDEQTLKSRITVSLSPLPALNETGDLRVNFIVVPDNNGFAERLEIEQEGKLVYASGIVNPGYQVEWAHAPQVHLGPATATVYAVDDSGNDRGNPVSAEIEVVEA